MGQLPMEQRAGAALEAAQNLRSRRTQEQVRLAQTPWQKLRQSFEEINQIAASESLLKILAWAPPRAVVRLVERHWYRGIHNRPLYVSQNECKFEQRAS